MRKLLLIPIVCLGLAGCGLPEKINATANKYEADLSMACGTAMALAPIAPAIAPWIIGGCGTAEAILKLAADPNSLAWVNDLIAKAQPK